MRQNKTAITTALPAYLQHTILLPVLQAGMPLSSILLADDDTEDCDIFIEVVNNIKPGLPVNLVHNGELLMRQLHATHEDELPGLVFLDLNMPLKNGHECLRELRSTDKLKHIPVVIYSTSVNKDYIEDTFKNGANFYLQKPYSVKGLEEALRKVLEPCSSELFNTQKQKFILSQNTFTQ